MTKDFSLSGTFQQKPFPFLLVDLKESGRTGILLVRKDAIEKKIFFLNGEPVACRSNRKKELIGEILRARGKISRAQLDEAILETKKETKDNFGEILLRKKFVTADELYSNTKYQFVSILFSLFGSEDGSYSFQARDASGLIPPGLPHFYVKFSKLISEGIRVIRDEGFVDRVLGGDEQFVKQTALTIPSEELSFGGADQVVLNALQERMMVKDVVAACGLEPGKVKKILLALSCLDAVELGAPGSLLDAAAVAAALTGGEERESVALEPPPSQMVTEKAGEMEADRSAESMPFSEAQVLKAEERGVQEEEVSPLPELQLEPEPSEVMEPEAGTGAVELSDQEVMQESEPEVPVSSKIEAAFEKARSAVAGSVAEEAPLEEALAAAAAEERGMADTPSPAEEALTQEEEPVSPFAKALAQSGAGAVLQGMPGEVAEPSPEGETQASEELEREAETEPEPVEAEAEAPVRVEDVTKKSPLTVPMVAGLAILLIGLGLVYFLKGGVPEPPVPPAATVESEVAAKSPADIIQELANEGAGEVGSKGTDVQDRPTDQPEAEEQASGQETAVTIREEAAPSTEKAVSVVVPDKDATKGEDLAAGTPYPDVKAPVPETVPPPAQEIAEVTTAPEATKPEAEAVSAEPTGKTSTQETAKESVAASPSGEDSGAADAKVETEPPTVRPVAKEDETVAAVPKKEAASKPPVKATEGVAPALAGDWEEHYTRGLDMFRDGNVEAAFKAWADTVRSAPDQAYAIQIELTSYLSYAARDVKEAAPDEKVFIVKTTLNDKEMYKVLCGFYPDKATAEQAFRVLTPYLKAQKPYLVRASRLKPKLQD